MVRMIEQDNWNPDYVVGLSGSGIIAAKVLSDLLGKPLYTINWGIHDHMNCHDAALAEDLTTNNHRVLFVIGTITNGNGIRALMEDLNTSVIEKIDWYGRVRIGAVNYDIESGFKVNYKINNINNETIKYDWCKNEANTQF